MWSELSLPWQAALEEAWASYCAGCIPIGSVVVTPAGEIIARGRNRIGEQSAPPRQVCDSQLAHAELNALLAMPNLHPERRGSTLYTTMEPCPLCMGAVYMSGVRGLAYACRDSYAGSTNLLGATPYYARKPFRVTAAPDLALEVALMAMVYCYYLENYPPAGASTVEAEWNRIVPVGVALGKDLWQNTLLRQMRAEDAPAPVVIDYLAGCL